MTAQEFNKLRNQTSSGSLSIKGLDQDSKQALVINIDCKDENDINGPIGNGINVYFGDNPVNKGETTDFSGGRVILNFYNTTQNTKITLNQVCCQVIAPNAELTIVNGNGNGNFVANKVNITGETHRMDFTGKIEDTSTSVSVKKVWKGTRGTAVIRLMAGDQQAKDVDGHNVEDWEVQKDSDLTHQFTNLPTKDAQGNPITYSVKEISINGESVDANNQASGYTSTVSKNNDGSFTVTNTENTTTPETTSVSVKKVWDDNNDQDGKRPDSIQVQLYANGEKSGDPVTLSESNTNKWTATWDNLDKNDSSGKAIAYTVKESGVPDGYKSEVSGNVADGFTITNTHTPETTSVSGTKTWDDKNDQDGKRPGFITIHLLSNGTPYGQPKTVIPGENGIWSYSFEGLPKYANGKPITYTITEDTVKDYSTEVNDYNVKNSYTPGKTSVTVTKAWNDNNNADKKRPDSIQVQLYANGEKSDDPVTLSESTKWTYTWSGLDAKKAGTDIKYTVEEVNTPSGYTSNVSGNAKTGFTITNTEEKTTPPTPVTPTYTTYTVHKVWDLGSGEAVPDSVQMQLYKNGAAYGSPVAVTRASGWTYTWTGLPQTENGKLNTWSVKEVDPDNQYTATVVNGTSSATVTNRSNNNAGGKTQVSVHKVWKLDNGRSAASSVQAQLYRNGEAYGDPVTLSAGNSWSHVWTGLTKTDAQGNTISWTVREVNVPSGFTSTVTGTDRSFTITNDDKPQDNHNKNNKPVNPNNNNNNNKPVTPNTNNKKNTPVNPGTPSIPKNTGTVANRGTSAGTPRTGDQTSLGFWLAMLTAGAAGTAAAVLLKRRNRKEEE
jgi:hypothetical protein